GSATGDAHPLGPPRPGGLPRPVADRAGIALPGALRAAQPDGSRLSHAVRHGRDLLPQHPDLLRQADPTRGAAAGLRPPAARRLPVPGSFRDARRLRPAGVAGRQHHLPAALAMARKIKVLVVDDSALVRQTLTDILAADPAIEVM